MTLETRIIIAHARYRFCLAQLEMYFMEAEELEYYKSKVVQFLNLEIQLRMKKLIKDHCE